MIRQLLLERQRKAHAASSSNTSETAFHERGTEVSRLEGFSDAAFAFALTLLVVSLEVPRTFEQLLDAMRGFAAFAVSFGLLLWVWYQHYKFFRRYGLQDGVTVLLNAALLFVVLFYVYPLKFLFTWVLAGFIPALQLTSEPPLTIDLNQTAQLLIIYGLGYTFVFVVFALLHVHAYRLRTTLGLNELEIFDTRESLVDNCALVGVGILSILIAALGGASHAALAGWIYFLTGPILGGLGVYYGRQRSLLEKHFRQSLIAHAS